MMANDEPGCDLKGLSIKGLGAITDHMVKVFPYYWPGGAHTLGVILNHPDHTGRLGIYLSESNVGKGAKLYGGAEFGGLDHDANWDLFDCIAFQQDGWLKMNNPSEGIFV
jgi:hypothetical protein